MSINEAQSQLIDAMGDCLRDSRLPVGEVLEPIMFMLTDVMSQMTDRAPEEDFAKDIAKAIIQGYVFHCTFDENEQNCPIQ